MTSKKKILYVSELKTPKFVKMSTRPEALACLEDEGAEVASVPAIPGLIGRILKQIKRAPNSFDMGSWHAGAPNQNHGADPSKGPTCGTAHCMAGWAIHFAGKAGYDLQDAAVRANIDDPYDAVGKAIFVASCPWLNEDSRFPFFTSDDYAIDWLKQQEELEKQHLASK